MKRNLFICLDIGNSSTSYGIYNGRRLVRTGWLSSYDLPNKIVKLIGMYIKNPKSHILISSVVPVLTMKIVRVIRKNGAEGRIWIAGCNLKVPIRHKYQSLNRLGIDRALNAYGGMRCYGGPLLILDFGTALTCDYVSKSGVFEGGLIIPGPEIALQALFEKAALLPRIPFPKEAKAFIGRDTRSGMKAGILRGYGAMADGLIKRFRQRFGSRLRVVATGGFARAIRPYSSQIQVIDGLLTLRALVLLGTATIYSHCQSNK